MENETTSAVEQEIANAFAEFATDTPPAAAAKTPEEIAAEADAAKTAAAATKTPEEIAAEADAAKTAAAATKTPEEIAAEADAAKTAAAATKTIADDTRIADLQAQIEALKPKEQPAPAAPVYSADEEATLKKYSEDWPDIQKAEALARRAEYRELVGYVFKEFNQEIAKIKAEYAPAIDYVENRSGHDQYSDIVKLVPDYDQVRDKALAWVDTQPEWLKAAYKNVAENGTPTEVAGLIGMYKKESGIVTAPVVAAAAAPVIPATPVALAPAAKAAAAKLTVVKTGRSEAGTATEDTFENAFANYAAEEDKRLSGKR